MPFAINQLLDNDLTNSFTRDGYYTSLSELANLGVHWQLIFDVVYK